jgi:galactitol-specific phosphotransferase system IIC component
MIAIFKSAAAVVAGLAFALAAVVCAFVLTLMQNISRFFKKAEDVVTVSLKGGLGVWGYILIGLVVLAVFNLGVIGFLAAVFKYAVCYAIAVVLIAMYNKVARLGSDVVRRVLG